MRNLALRNGAAVVRLDANLITLFIKVLAVATDNASNNDVLMRELSRSLEIHGVTMDPKNHHSRCLAHIINLSARAAIHVARGKGKYDVVADEEDDSDDDDVPASNADVEQALEDEYEEVS